MSVASKKYSPSAVEDSVAPVYALLAELLSREIDEGLLEVLRLTGVGEILTRVEPDLAPVLEGSWDGAIFQEHAVEFCRLFVYPGECLPIAGRWTGNAGDETFSIRRWFTEEGASPDMAKHLAELSDTHVAKILSVRAGLTGAPDEVIADYEREMIEPWRRAFAKQLSECARLPVYRAVADILDALD
jgi:TorA maturation chaperone TorD